MSDVCPFCGRDPFEYVDNGVGMEAVAVTCCNLGDAYFRGMRPDPETVEMDWGEFREIGHRLAQQRAEAALATPGAPAVPAERVLALEVIVAKWDAEAKVLARGNDWDAGNRAAYKSCGNDIRRWIKTLAKEIGGG